MIEHGGDPARAGGVAGVFSGDWLDLSTGINPVPYPHAAIPAAAYASLPASRLFDEACQAAAGFYGVPGNEFVTATPGTQAALQWLPRLRPASRVAIVSPTYGEHEHTWRAAGHAVELWPGIPAEGSRADVVVVVNPNNPDGRRAAPERLFELARHLGQRGGWLVVDEAFAEVAPEISLAGRAGTPGLVILRSFGKFFGLAGVRLGFVLAWPALAERLAAALGAWAVSGPALTVAAQALQDTAWVAATRERLRADARRLDGMLNAAGLPVLGGTDLFRLAAAPKAPLYYDRLLRAGIAVRWFRDHPEWLRFGLPAGEGEWTRLAEGLQSG